MSALFSLLAPAAALAGLGGVSVAITVDNRKQLKGRKLALLKKSIADQAEHEAAHHAKYTEDQRLVAVAQRFHRMRYEDAVAKGKLKAIVPPIPKHIKEHPDFIRLEKDQIEVAHLRTMVRSYFG